MQKCCIGVSTKSGQDQAAMRHQNIDSSKAAFSNLIQEIIKNSISHDWITISSFGENEWEKFIAGEAIKLTENDCGKLAKIEPITAKELNIAKDIVTASLCTIARYDSDMYDEIQEQVHTIKLFNGKVTMGLTDVRMLGAMFIRLPCITVNPMLYFLEHIIHEASHIHLNCLMAVDPCILNPSEQRFISPLRADPRPMIGVFHATFVSARIARTMIKLYQATNNPDLLQTLAETLDEAIRGLMEIGDHAILTSVGKQLVDGIKEIIESGKNLSIWKNYNFLSHQRHRFGSGSTKISEFKRLVA